MEERMPTDAVPAAQYLRMSTEHQQYSLRNQAATVRDYASRCGFKIIKTYSDAGRSGLTLRNRPALSSLLRDVVAGNVGFRAVLVYDISRWGRFQDTDEAAHYEFLCKSAGIPIHYCAEQFTNDGTIPNLIMKALKRAMAGEYSRELGTKVYDGQKRLAQLGFHIGRQPRYGLRRMLVSADGRRRMILRPGQRKSLTTDRIVLVPGPRREQQIVKEIFESRAAGETAISIARRLNARGVPYIGGRKWNAWSIQDMLHNPKYAGCNCWGRTTQRLSLNTKRMPQETWTMRQGAFPAIVSWTTFQRVQELLANPCKYSDEEMLNALRRLLGEKGRLSERIVSEAPGLPCPSQYGRRFGSTRRAYQLIGYEQLAELTSTEQRVHSIKLRNELIAKIMEAAWGNVRLAKRDEKRRPHLIVNEQFRVSVLICPSRPTNSGQLRWVYYPVDKENASMKLACALDESNSRIKQMYVLRSHIGRRIMTQQDFAARYGLRLRTPAGFARRVIAVARNFFT